MRFLLAAAMLLPVLGDETGKFVLYKFQQPIGEETWSVAAQDGGLKLHSDFTFTDRGSKVSLTADLETGAGGAPVRFEAKGKSSRMTTVDTAITVEGGKAAVRTGKRMRSVEIAGQTFMLDGYAPVAVQMMMVRFWKERGRPEKLSMLPGGELEIQPRGQVKVGGADFEQFTIKGLIWGRESLWMDGENRLAAVVGVDTEFDHFEAVAEKYAPLVGGFIAAAAANNLEELAKQSAPQLQPGPVYAVTGATLIDGTGRPALRDAVVVIENGRIRAAGSRRQVKLPKNMARVDAAGKFLVPGLWDMHAHYEQVEWGPVYLASGVTTVRDCGNEMEMLIAVRRALQAGQGLGPRVLAAGIVDGDSKTALGIVRANTPEEARAVVQKYKAAGFEQIKIYSSVKPEIVKAICMEAHAAGLTVIGHVPRGMDAMQAVEAGMDGIEHLIPYLYLPMFPKDSKRIPGSLPVLDLTNPTARENIAFFKAHGTVVDPTIALFELMWRPKSVAAETFEPGAAKVARELAGGVENEGLVDALAQMMAKSMRSALDLIGALHKEGVPLVIGTDQAVPGHSVHREMELFVQAGLTPLEAIQAATIVPARAMKLDKESGTLEAGKRADMVLLNADPLEAIRNIRQIHRVVTAGRMYAPAPLWQSVGFQP